MNNPNLNISGVVLSGPLTGAPPNVKIDMFRMFFVKQIAEHLPELIINPRLNVSSITKNAALLKWFISDAKIVPILGARQVSSMLQYFNHFKYNAKLFTYPLLVHLGSEDQIVNNKSTKEFFEKVGSNEKQLFEYEGAYHELQHED
mmetsp:Transcript_11124/g.12513  ORF Transcript_11124/g.12513 Transcript_11124/m.12513 type:complete len:146 (-) Transcript_11124:301-738(-)